MSSGNPWGPPYRGWRKMHFQGMSIWPALDIYDGIRRVRYQKCVFLLSVHKQGETIPKYAFEKVEPQLYQRMRVQHFTFEKTVLEMELRLPSG